MKKATTDNKSVNEIINNYKNKEPSNEAKAVLAYVESKISKHVVLPKRTQYSLYKLTDLYHIDNILEAIDISSDNYLCYAEQGDNEDYLMEVEDFISKIGGILYNKSRKI